MNILYFAVLSAICFSSVMYYLLEVVMGQQMYEKNKIQARLEYILARKQQPAKILQHSKYSSITALNRIFKRQKLPQQIYQLLSISGWNIPVSVFFFADLCWGFMILFVVFLTTKSHAAAVVCGIFGTFIPYQMLLGNKKKYIKTFSEKFPDALVMMKNALRAGQSIQSAFEIVAQEAPKPVSTEFERLIREVELGSTVNEALNLLYKRINTLDLRVFVLGVYIQQEVGGNLSELLHHIEKTIRERMTLAKEMNALSAQGRMSGMFIVAIPIFLTLAISALNPGYIAPLFETEAGKQTLMIAVGLQFIGGFLIKKITTFNTIN
jgi:tight adherence protein B